MPQNRQLAAIMFSDIAGYTALMGEDESGAFELLKNNRQMQKPLIERFGGQWIKEIGDGVLASFSTVTDAVKCACSIQEGTAMIPKLKLRIGIHQGEVIFEDGDVFGDGVNIASRLQALAPIGGIWVSESIYQNVSNKKDIEIFFAKEELLKNVKERMRIYEIRTSQSPPSVIVPQSTYIDFAKIIPEKSIAVLPFLNLSNDPEQEYFSDGMAEEIINSLSHLKDLKVAGRSSSFQFKGNKIDLKEIKEKLGVHTVLEGSVRKYGNIIRLTVQLINVEDGFHLWSERYERTLDNIFAIQDEIAFAITEKLKVTLLEKERASITKVYTENTQAYEFYLKGRFYLNRRGISIVESLGLFEKAIDLDPDFALAHAGLADACLLSSLYCFKPVNEVMPKAKNAANRSLELDPSLYEPHSSLGFYYAAYEWDWAKSKEHFLKALEMNPTYVLGCCWYSIYYLAWVEGKFQEAEKLSQFAIKLDPLTTFPYAALGTVYYTFGKYEESIQTANAAIELDAGSYISHRLKGHSLMALKRYDEAIECLEYTCKISRRFPLALGDLVAAYAEEGSMEKARKIMDELKAYPGKGIFVGPVLMGLSLSCIGELDEAMHWLEEAFRDHDTDLLMFKFMLWAPEALKAHKPFQKLVSLINFPD